MQCYNKTGPSENCDFLQTCQYLTVRRVQYACGYLFKCHSIAGKHILQSHWGHNSFLAVIPLGQLRQMSGGLIHHCYPL
jgi:hypothetical protein